MKIDLLGIKIDSLSKKELLQNIESRLARDGSIFIVTPYSESIVRAQKDQEFRKILNSADFALPDGMGILWAAKFLGLPTIPEKISGSEFVWDLARIAAQKNLSVFLLGGFDDTPEKVARVLKSKNPNLKIAGINNRTPHPLSLSSSRGEGRGEENVVDLINSSHADFLFVALGPVAQEKWIYENLPNLRVKLAIGLGGTFDYLAGKRPQAPRFLRHVGLEWLWRLLTQPWRVWRITKGVLGLICQSLKAKL